MRQALLRSAWVIVLKSLRYARWCCKRLQSHRGSESMSSERKRHTPEEKWRVNPRIACLIAT